MEFCDKCGTLMRPVKEDNTTILKCPNCNYQSKNNNINQKISSKIKHNPLEATIPVFDKKTATLPIMKHTCPECNNSTVFWWTRQTRSSDEPETRFYKCTKCNHTWREYS